MALAAPTQYGAENELTQEQSARAGGYTNQFGYDAAFNPTTFKGQSASFNANNQNTQNTYDERGNPTTYRGVSVTWDAENRLTQYGGLFIAGYRPDSLRAWKQDSSGHRTYFLYSGGEPIIELDGQGNISAVNTFGPTGLLSRHSATGSTFYTRVGAHFYLLDASRRAHNTIPLPQPLQ